MGASPLRRAAAQGCARVGDGGARLVPVGHVGQRVDGVVREVVDGHQRDQSLEFLVRADVIHPGAAVRADDVIPGRDLARLLKRLRVRGHPRDRSGHVRGQQRQVELPDHEELHAGSGYPVGPADSALDRSTSNSTPTSSRSLSAPKKPLYGLIPKADCSTVPDPRYRPGPASVTCSRTGCVLPLSVSVPSIAPPLAPERMIRDEVKLAVASPRIALICFLMSRRSPSLSGLAPPVPSRTSSEPRSSSAVTLAAVTPPSSSAGTSTCADHRVTSRVRSWPALAASPARPVLMTTRPASGPSRKLPVYAVTAQ